MSFDDAPDISNCKVLYCVIMAISVIMITNTAVINDNMML